MKRATVKEREAMERQFGKRHGRGAAEEKRPILIAPGPASARRTPCR